MAVSAVAGATWLRLSTGAAGAALSVFAIRVSAAGLAYGAQVIAARLMGWEGYGIYASLWVWAAMLGHTLTLGLSQGACRFLPVDQARGDIDHARGYLLAGALIALATSVGVALLGLGALGLAPGLLTDSYRTPFLLAACLLPLLTFQDYLEGVARSQNWVVLAILPTYLLRQLVMVSALTTAMLAGAPPRAEVAMACMLLAAALSTALQALVLSARLRRVLPAGPRRFRARHWLRTCLPIALVDLATTAFGFVDVLLLGLLMPPAAVGLYFAATRVQQFMAFVPFAATAATAQRFSAAHARHDRDGLARLVRLQGRATAAATLAAGLAVLAAGPPLLALFGDGFAAGVPVLAVLVLGGVAASVFGPGEDLLTMLGGERLCAAITLAALLLAVLFGLCLIPAFGLLGAAASMAAATVLRAAALAWAARAMHGLATPVWSGVRAVRADAAR
ncbi:lipopolysaccharide biosynthesis protein [Methylobacterium radiodurans]|uniref:Polysaccharide biosynthesis protein n=1 Tax=Methylobacterium radiodurans TaxID=2202828 RepID=A0A2U8VWS5_9HYPH|nr:lipopolysaccharide biosynthesis protein [Methylobacterium radiodurans]AWN38239.1 polysaccharide biosynthesis protein [Methylobacterium radiodurans]